MVGEQVAVFFPSVPQQSETLVGMLAEMLQAIHGLVGHLSAGFEDTSSLTCDRH